MQKALEFQMPVFSRTVEVEVIHAPRTSEEKRWSTSMGGDLKTKALFYAPDRVASGDEIHATLFDEPRVITAVDPITTVDGSLSYWEARMLPRSQWQRENSLLPRQRENG